MSLLDIARGLHKQASKKEEDKSGKHALAAGAGALAVTSGAGGRLLGYETVHHGTPKSENVAAIKKHGLSKSKAGTGAGAIDIKAGHVTHDNLKGRVFTTTNKAYAQHYTKKDMFDISGSDTRVLKAHVPYRAKSRLHTDHIMEDIVKGRGAGEGAGAVQRQNAKGLLNQTRIYKHSIKSRFIEGGKGYAGKKQFATTGNMRRYLSQAGGKARFATGIAQSAAAAGLGAMSLHNAARALKDKKD